MAPGTIYELAYLPGWLVRLDRIITKERRNGKMVTLPEPRAEFTHIKDGKTFGCPLKDLQRYLKFKQWKEIMR